MKKVQQIGDHIIHRTWTKVILNPILTKFGWILVSVIDEDTNEFIRYQIRQYPENCPGPFMVWIKVRI